MRWFSHEIHGTRILVYIVWCNVLCVAVSILSVFTMKSIGLNVPPVEGAGWQITSPLFFILLLYAAAMEELLFRLPLAIVISKEWPLRKILLFAIMLSSLFGVAHGSIHHIFIQGVVGFLWCILFLKCGGMQKKYGKAFAVTTFAHFAFNGAISLALLNHGVDTF